MPEQALGGISLGFGLLWKINFMYKVGGVASRTHSVNLRWGRIRGNVHLSPVCSWRLNCFGKPKHCRTVGLSQLGECMAICSPVND